MMGFDLIAENLGISIENIFFIAIMLGCIILYAADFRLGILLQFVFSSLCAMWFYAAGWDYKYAIITSVIFIIILSLTFLYEQSPGSQRIT